MDALFNNIRKTSDQEDWKKKLTQKPKVALAPSLPRGFTRKDIEDRWKILLKNSRAKQSTGSTSSNNGDQTEYTPQIIKDMLLDAKTLDQADLYKNNIENFIGVVKVPLGVTGPIRVNGLFAKGDYYIPMATTEAALIASYNRGMRVISEAGGCVSVVVDEGISRDPVLVFDNLREITEFTMWSKPLFDQFKAIAETTTKFGKLMDIKYTVMANYLHMKFIYNTADASGQNMVTIATDAVCKYILKNSPIKPRNLYIEGGMSADKKACVQHLLSVRGKKVVCECIIPRALVEKIFHTTVEQYNIFQTMGMASSYLVGFVGSTLHYTNALTSMAIALGQDPACASESHIGVTHGHVTPEGDMYTSVTMPNLLLATVGGGTKLPTQRACLELMGLFGRDKVNELCEITAGVCLAGELSLAAAILSDDFANAHKMLARGNQAFTKEMSVQEQFEKAAFEIMKMSNVPSKETLMKLYGYYKQGSIGDVNIAKPGKLSTDFKGKAKYKAWANMKGMSKEDAMKQYIALVQQIIPTFKFEHTDAPAGESTEPRTPVSDEFADMLAEMKAPTPYSTDDLNQQSPAVEQNNNNNSAPVTPNSGQSSTEEVAVTPSERPTDLQIKVPSTTNQAATKLEDVSSEEMDALRERIKELENENEKLKEKMVEIKRLVYQ